MAPKVYTEQDVYKEYAYAANLIASDPSGALAGFFNDIKKYMNAHKGAVPPNTWMAAKRASNSWWSQFDSDQQKFQMEQADPALKLDLQKGISNNRDILAKYASEKGVPLTDAELDELAVDSRKNNWINDTAQVDKRLQPYLKASTLGSKLEGNAGDYQNQLTTWVQQNGLGLSTDAVSKYVANMTFNKQSLEDVKDDLRKTYLMGAYPAWADKIAQGNDPSALFSAYTDAGNRVLERDDINLNDPMMRQITQAVGSDGKPRVVPLYEAEKIFRSQPGWQKTNNAYATYTDVAQQLLQTFGFR